MNTALLIIDVQRALCEGPYEVLDAPQVIGRINLVAAKCRAAGAPVVVIQHECEGDVLAYRSPGWQLAEGLHTEPGDTFVRKTASDAFHRTELESMLQGLHVGRLVICGMQTDFCVDTTTRRALALGFEVTLVEDAHSTLDNGCLTAAQIIAHHNTTLAHLDSFGPRVTLVAAADFTLEHRSAPQQTPVL